MEKNTHQKETPLKKIKTPPGKKKLNRIRYKQKSGSKTTSIPEYVWKFYGIPIPIPEYKFFAKRKWRIDYAWPNNYLAVEIEGGVYSRGRHIRPTGFINDMEKYNCLILCGWKLLRFTPKNINYELIRMAINYDNRYTYNYFE
jgi:hypothetical protein